jgi:steroid 5-alpha reductase family enzyme
MNKKTKDLIVVGFLYIISFVIAYFVYLNVSLDSMILELLIADLAAMLFIYVMSLILNNASLYDPYWSVIPPVFLIFVFIESGKTLTLPHFMMLFAISFWGVRLTLNWIKGWHGFSEVDWRYLMIRDKAPKLYFLTNFLAIQLFPTLIVFAQLIVGIKILTIDPSLNIVFTIGFLLVILATTIQYISDEQMRRFRKAHVGEKKCIDEGLWRLSRHPNYFGEVTVWWGLYIMLFGLTYQFDLYILAPLSMTLLFVFISIPMMEKKILKTRPEYKLYQEQVSMLVPFLRKQKEASVYQKES